MAAETFKKSRIKKHIIRSLILGLITVASLELVLWTIFPVRHEQRYRKEVKQNLPGLKSELIYTRNEFGLRSLSMKTKIPPPNTVRIICLGASTTDQPTQAIQDTWSGILESMLNAEFSAQGARVEIAAYGRGSETIIDRLFWARKNLLSFQPNLVIIMEGINDLCWHGGSGYTFKGIPIPKEKKGSNILEFSQIFRRFKIIKHRLLNYLALKMGKAIEWHSRNLPELRQNYKNLPYQSEIVRENDPIHEFAAGLTALLSFLSESGVEAIVIGQPVLWMENMDEEERDVLWFHVNTPNGPIRPSGKWLAEEMTRYNDVQKDLAKQNKAEYEDLDKKIPRSLEFFFDDCHFTDRGSEKVASELFPIVRAQIVSLLRREN